MATDEYVVLRVEEVVEEGFRALGSESAAAPVDVKVETHTLDAHEADALGSQGHTVARTMPVALFEPLEASEENAAASSGAATWGLEAVGALGSPRTGAGVKVAILDTGIDATHPAFRGKRIVQQDFTGEGDGDGNGHGTHCAGTVLGGEVDGMRIGVAPGVTDVLIGKVLDSQGRGSTKQILDGLLWAAQQGANVISLSLGLDFPGQVARGVRRGLDVKQATSMALEDYRNSLRLFDSVAAVMRASSAMFARTLVVAAAGNESRRPDFSLGTAPPAAADGFLAVGALGRGGAGATAELQVASFSNAGPAVSAPGVDVASAAVGGGLRSLSGTSMATPHVAGVAALWVEHLLAHNPHFAVGELEGKLSGQATRRALAASAVPTDYGAGLVQAPTS